MNCEAGEGGWVKVLSCHKQAHSKPASCPAWASGASGITKLQLLSLCLLAPATGAGLEEICNYIFHIIVELN